MKMLIIRISVTHMYQKGQVPNTKSQFNYCKSCRKPKVSEKFKLEATFLIINSIHPIILKQVMEPIIFSIIFFYGWVLMWIFVI